MPSSTKRAVSRSRMTPEHKAALAHGREQGRMIRVYLEAVERERPRRGRKKSTTNLAPRLAAIDEALPTADPLTRVKLIQERMDIERMLDSSGPDMRALEAGFIEVALEYSGRKGITY